MKSKYDFCGYATKNDLKCSDGRTIRRNAFKDNDGQTVPLVWQHQHDSPENVLGHALLENRSDGVYAYGKFNDTEMGQNAKLLVEHGDIKSLSIYANQLKQVNGDVLHGSIREVSLVLAGANPGASIDFPILSHGEESETEATIYTGEEFELSHADEEPEAKPEESLNEEGEKKMASERTVKDVLDEMTDEQKKVVEYLVGAAMQEGVDNDEDIEEEENMSAKHNVFENDNKTNTLSHSEMTTILADAKRLGSLKESVLQHSDEYGIDNISYLFPEDHMLDNAPGFIKRNDEWVDVVMKSVKHTPFSRIKSVYANITEDDARAKGYIKGNQKTSEVFPLLKRTTSPTTIYKHQKLDRDDIVDIVDFDVVSWLKTEMRMMLDEEIARAILVGDGRTPGTDDKIDEDCIRPIWTDNGLYTIKSPITAEAEDTEEDIARKFIRQAVIARKYYKGSGNPVLYTTDDILTSCLLIEDLNGRVIYDSVDKLATAMRVSKIVTVPVMEGLVREDSDAGTTNSLLGIIVNLNDYIVGADKGGAVNMFDDFDIDYNQQKYLIETRISGSMIRPYSAIAIELAEESSED